ncbi:MAG: tetratricopeptide repeat protein, partial [Spirulina sp. SIO3F2]|nr:tetratricopeptide repeat protein [Spirulina sp. SIO3F2]
DYYEQGFRVAQALDDRQSANEFLRSIGQLGWQGGRQEFLETLAFFQAKRPEFLAAGDLGSIAVSAEAISRRADQALPEARMYLQQSLEIMQSQGQPEQVAHILEHLGQLFRNQSQFEMAAADYQKALEIYQKTQNREKELDILFRLAEIYGNRAHQLDAQKAIEFYQQALRIHQEYDVDLGSEGRTLGHIARIYQQQENFAEALRYYQRQLDVYKGDASQTATVLSNIAELYVTQGDDETAIDYYYQSIEQQQQSNDSYRYHSITYKLGKIAELELKRNNLNAVLNAYNEHLVALQAQGDEQAIADFFVGLSNVYLPQHSGQESDPNLQAQLDQFTEAMIDLCQRGLEILGPEGDSQVRTSLLGRLGKAYRQQEQYELALDAYQRKLTLHEELEPQEEWNTQYSISTTLSSIARIYQEQGNIEKAIAYYQQQVEHQRHSSLSLFFDLLNTLDNIGRIYREQDDFEMAIAIYQNELEFAKAQETQSLYAELLGRIARLYRSLNNNDQALDYFRQQLVVQQNNQQDEYGSSQSDILQNLADIHLEKGDAITALDYLQAAVRVSQELGEPYYMLRSFGSLGYFYSQQGQYSEALSTYQQQLGVAQEWGEPRFIAGALSAMGGVYYQLENHDQAIDHHQQALKIYQAIDDEYFAVFTSRALGEIYQEQGDYQQAIQYYDYVVINQKSLFDGSLFDVLSALGFIYQELAEYDQAFSYYQQAYDFAQAKEYDRGHVRSLAQLAGLFEAQGDFPKAINHYRQAITTNESIRARAEQGAENSENQASEENLNEWFRDIYQDFAHLLNQQGRTEEAKAVLELLSIPEID